MGPVRSRARGLVRSVIARAKSNGTLYERLYELANAAEFTDLYEHEKMLADSVRVEAYAAAIRRHVNRGDVVVDLGTGTGILAMMAARQGATVYAIDHAACIEIAERAALENGIGTIEFIKTHSRDFDAPNDVDIVLHEQIGDELFNEWLIENLLDLKQRLLRPGGTILPGQFELFLEPVRLRDDHRVPFLWETTIAGFDYGFLRNDTISQKYRSTECPRRFIESSAVEAFLGRPEPVLSFDINTMSSPEALPEQVTVKRTVRNPGVMDGLCLYFRVIFDDEIRFTTAPGQPRTSWHTRLLRTPKAVLEMDDEIQVTIEIDPHYNTGMWSVSANGSALS